MALSRCGIVLAAGILLLGSRAAVSQSPGTQPLTYDQMQAAQKQTQAAQDEANAKAAKKNSGTANPAPDATPAAAAAITATHSASPEAAPADAAAPAAGSAVAAGDVPPAAGKDPNAPPAAPKPQFDKHGKLIKEKVKKEKPPKLVPVDIVHGELTVDGLIAKAGLNFQIIDLKYLYIWVPGLGTAVLSNQPFAGSKIQINALDGSTLTVKVDGHQLQLACDGDMLDREANKKLFESKKKKDKPISMYVALDTSYQKGSSYPEMGYGDQNKAPYSWPGTLADLKPNEKAPPLPENLKQKVQIVKVCAKNPDGSQGACHDTEIPLVLSKNSKAKS